jgi:hypothetical protein
MPAMTKTTLTENKQKLQFSRLSMILITLFIVGLLLSISFLIWFIVALTDSNQVPPEACDAALDLKMLGQRRLDSVDQFLSLSDGQNEIKGKLLIIIFRYC